MVSQYFGKVTMADVVTLNDGLGWAERSAAPKTSCWPEGLKTDGNARHSRDIIRRLKLNSDIKQQQAL